MNNRQVARPQLSKSDFVNPDVLNAVNPHPFWGYVHGPIPNNNLDWHVQPSHTGHATKQDVALALASHSLQAPMVTMNLYNIYVCDISLHGTVMCGVSFRGCAGMLRHVRSQHSGAANPGSRKNLGIQEETAGDNAMRRWVLMGGWRDAIYYREPTKDIISDSPIGYYCGVLEEIARNDAQFAAEYGTQFHRPGHREWAQVMNHLTHHSPNQPMPLVVPSTPGDQDSVTSSRCEQSTLTEPTSGNGPNDNPGSTSGSEHNCGIVTTSVSEVVFEVDSEPEEQEEWPVDAVTDIFAGMYLPSSKLDAAYGPMPEEMD
ncbi:hypothetical protein N7489_011381 [Penicillium chrysogenum]|uniref:C2H2-type domain-containing protein n=1 Tax=Penicillium chrysogenum TaxID=5076 RepID=A0ABQ8W356_PENCH|nr:uncharacterized protein N7489_011381 [Penicillium chrysogenum]KAJ5230673.1 hypothetical protein N7489_011381 [Penicillium chrysogenum]KAJ5254549.1 hypothetical protein N7505_011758 [Penicillium chrysogenum]KAJ5268149.1 hypothetical protein N7524_005608 [Penicillium chrysogenum]